jgi:hypothetical protein
MTLSQVMMFGLLCMGAGMLVVMIGMFFVVRSIDKEFERLRELPWRED